jgi:hypothetical protein
VPAFCCHAAGGADYAALGSDSLDAVIVDIWFAAITSHDHLSPVEPISSPHWAALVVGSTTFKAQASVPTESYVVEMAGTAPASERIAVAVISAAAIERSNGSAYRHGAAGNHPWNKPTQFCEDDILMMLFV